MDASSYPPPWYTNGDSGEDYRYPVANAQQYPPVAAGPMHESSVLPSLAASAWPQENTTLPARLPETHGPVGSEPPNGMLGIRPGRNGLSSATYGSSSMQAGAIVPVNQRADYVPTDCLDDIRTVCKDAQGRITALGNAISRQPGVPSTLIEMVNTDLRHIAQQFVHTSFYCRKLETKLEEQEISAANERNAVMAAHTLEISSYRRRAHVDADLIAKLEEQLRDSEQGYGNADKRRKVELEKKTEKINNQKRRIKEQQDQIEKLKDKYVNPGKPGYRPSVATSRSYDDSSSELEFPHSATSEMGYRSSPPIAAPRYTSTLDDKDEEFLLNNLQKLGVPSAPSRHATQASYGHFNQSMNMHPMNPMNNSMNSMGPINTTMGGAMAPYPGFPPQMGPYGAPVMPDYGYSGPTNGVMSAYPHAGYGGTYATAAPAQHYALSRSNTNHSRSTTNQSRTENGRASRGPEMLPPTNALVLRRQDDSEIDPETKTWKDMFVRFFTACNGWAEMYATQIIPGAVDEVTSKNAKLWEYILKVATCYKDPQAAPKHALFMLNSPGHRGHFVARLLLQYIQQEVFTWRFWLGWDDDTDVRLNSLGPIIDATGHSLDTRRDARQQLRRIIEEIAKDEDYARFKKYKQNQHVNRLRDIGGPFVYAGGVKEALIGLHSLANNAMEISMKMMTSRLTFTFTWNECAVKYSHESHVALNSDQHGLALQHKHTRVGLVVTPSISYRDDSGRSIVPRGVSKASVLIMN